MSQQPSIARPRSVGLGLALVASLALIAPAQAAEPVEPPVEDPAASTEETTEETTTVAVGDLDWSAGRKPKTFASAIVNEVASGPEGRLVLAGALLEQGFMPDKGIAWGSDDGERWKPLKGKLPKGSEIFSVATTDTGFVLAGGGGPDGGQVWTSDGASLTPIESPDGFFYGVAAGPLGLHVAGILEGRPAVWSSSDAGTTWNGALLADNDGVALHVAVTDDGTIVVLGRLIDGETSTPMAWSSVDGVMWTSTTLPVEPGQWSTPDLETTPVGLLALLQTQGVGQALLSSDGVSWEPVLEDDAVRAVGTLGGEAIVFGADRLHHSADGTTWTSVDEPDFGGVVMTGSAELPDGGVVASGFVASSLGSEAATLKGTPAEE